MPRLRVKDYQKVPSVLFAIVICLTYTAKTFNVSACSYIELENLYFLVNTAQNNENIVTVDTTNKTTTLYNLCHTLEYWCEFDYTVYEASMVVVTATETEQKCEPFTQDRIELIDTNNATKGVKIIYASQQSAEQRAVSFECIDDKVTPKICPRVTRTTIWEYFSQNSVTYTVAIEIIGVIFMVLGVYLYRITTIIIGWSTSFLLLLLLSQEIVFKPGVSDEVVSDVMVITIICCFLIGYVIGYFPKVGLFCMGMWIGLIISLTLNNIAFYRINSDPPTLPLFITMPILCIIFGVVTVCVKKTFIIFATSLIGAYMCLRALSWHLGAFPNEFLYSREYQLGIEGTVDWEFYLYVIALLILSASASALQYWLFKKKSEKTHGDGDIEEHFNRLENQMEAERQNLADFNNIFNEIKSKVKEPRVLKRENNMEQFEIESKMKKREKTFSSISMSSEGVSDSEEQKQPPISETSKQRRQRIEKERKENELHEDLLKEIKNKKKNKKF